MSSSGSCLHAGMFLYGPLLYGEVLKEVKKSYVWFENTTIELLRSEKSS